MERINQESAGTNACDDESGSSIAELDDLQLAMVGGGNADPIMY